MRKPWYKRLADKIVRYRGRRVKVIVDRFTGEPYMIRYRVLDLWFIKVRLHQIVRPDHEPKLHDHPYPFFHYVLEAGYAERNDSGVHFRKPGFWAFRRSKYRHSISQLTSEESWIKGDGWISPTRETFDAWTLVIRGPTLRAWGFHCSGEWVNHNDYERRRAENVGWEC